MRREISNGILLNYSLKQGKPAYKQKDGVFKYRNKDELDYILLIILFNI